MLYWNPPRERERHYVYYVLHWHGGNTRKQRRLIVECQLDVTVPRVVVLVVGDTDNPRKVHKYTGYGKPRGRNRP